MYGHTYTEAEREFMVEFVPGHSHAEIRDAFAEKFGWDITKAQVKSYIARNHLNTGRDGRFTKGHVPDNKGKKMSPEVYEKAKATMFKKGNMPVKHRPVGSERISKDGYLEVKIAEPRKWRLKHLVVYEQHYGPIPKGHAVTFLDSNKMNIDISNLKLIKRSELLIMNSKRLHTNNAELTEVGINIAKVIDAKHKSVRRRKELEY